MQVTKESETRNGYCQCGRPLHYTSQSIKYSVCRIIELAKDPFVTITVTGVGSYRVQRHFIALHGIVAAKMEEYGFEKIPTTLKEIPNVGN